MHPKLRQRSTIRLLKALYRIPDHALNRDFDQHWARQIDMLVSTSIVDYGVVLGFDGAGDIRGQRDPDTTQLIVPPEWVFWVCKRYPRLLPGPSINPHLHNALDTLEACIEHKAVLIKWLPSAQLIHPSNKKVLPFYRKMATAGIPLLIHCGGERTFIPLDPSLGEVHHLRVPLEEGVKVICAHSATKPLGSKEQDQLPELRKLLDIYPNLWLDNSGICNPSRFYHLPQLAQDPLIQQRTLYGSDYPVPSNAFYYVHQLGIRRVWQAEKISNLISRDVHIKKTFGYPEQTLTRAHQVLANLDHWLERPTQRSASSMR